MQSPLETPEPVANLNLCCAPTTLDRQSLDARLGVDLDGKLLDELKQTHAHMFADEILYLSGKERDAIAGLVGVIEDIRHSETYRSHIGLTAPKNGFADPRTLGVFTSYDFHLTADGPRLIEINTNAGGAFLAAAAGASHRGCCGILGCGMPSCEKFEARVLDMFFFEWTRAGHAGRPETIAILDDAPESQYLYPEFLMIQTLFRRAGINAVIIDPAAISHSTEGLLADGLKIDLVYNRHTDFALVSPELAPLRQAVLAGTSVVTPHPFHHAVLADKSNMIALSDPDLWADAGVPPDLMAFAGMVPRTLEVTLESADRLWQERKAWFFKPRASHAGKGVYRGAKLTKSTWKTIVSGGYIAQEAVEPGKRLVRRDDTETILKADLRAYTYGAEIILLAGRLYQGQVTNMRTPGGGFAPVVVV